MTTHKFIDKAIKSQRMPDLEEYDIHCVIADYLNLVIKRPSRWWTIEVSNQQSGKAGMIKQMALKRKGVVTGTPDIIIMYRHYEDEYPHTELIFLEVKTKTGELTKKQEYLHEELKKDGHEVFVVRDVSEVEKILKDLYII